VRATTDPTPRLPDWLTAIGTVATALLAVLLATRDQIARWFFRPQLRLNIKQGPPDCTTIAATDPVRFSGGPTIGLKRNQFYCRFSVNNEGRLRAIDVAVRLMRLWCFAHGSWVTDASFFPLQLTWSNVGGTVVPDIDPQLPRHCDFCHTTRTKPDRFRFNTDVVPNEVAPDVLRTIKPPGTYRCELAVTAANARADYAIVELKSDGSWSDDAVEMATQHLVPTVLRRRSRPYGKPD